jgi:hypothetical protein
MRPCAVAGLAPGRRARAAAREDKDMTATTMPSLQIRNSNGGSWHVHAQFPDGTADDIGGFKTENEANEWIAKELQRWLDEREKQRV